MLWAVRVGRSGMWKGASKSVWPFNDCGYLKIRKLVKAKNIILSFKNGPLIQRRLTCLILVLNWHTCRAVGCEKFYKITTQTFGITSKFLPQLYGLGLIFEMQEFVIVATFWNKVSRTRNLVQLYGLFVKICRLSWTFVFCPEDEDSR